MQSDLLDVVIGVVFAWFLLSLVLSGTSEAISWLTHARAKHLWLGIGKLADPSAKLVPRGLLDVVWRLPFAGSLDLRPRRAGGADPGRLANPETRSTGLAPMQQDNADKARRALVRTKNQNLYDRLGPAITEVANEGRLTKLTQLSAEAYSSAVAEVAEKVHKADVHAAAEALGWADTTKRWLIDRLESRSDEDVLTRDEVRALKDDDAASPTEAELGFLYQHAAHMFTARDLIDYYKENPALQAAVARAGDILDVPERVKAVRTAVETWFEHEMDGLSRLYRRQSRKILFILAIPLVLFAHANTITIFNDLRHDETLRQATVIAATESVAEELNEVCERAAEQAATTTTAPSTTTTIDPIAGATQQFECTRDVIDRAEDFRIGLAWQDLKDSDGTTGEKAEFQFSDVGPYLHDALWDDWGFLGRTLTLVALMFGAQFWYDALRRLVGLRKTLSGVGDSSSA